LDYEAYVELARADFAAIAAEAAERFGPLRIAIVHRTGRVALGEASVAIAVGTPHRAAAFDACEFAIDTLKARAPDLEARNVPRRRYGLDRQHPAVNVNSSACRPVRMKSPSSATKRAGRAR